MKYSLKYRTVLVVYACCMQLIDAAMCPFVMDGRGIKIRETLLTFFVVMILSFVLLTIRRKVGSCHCFEHTFFVYNTILLVLYVFLLICAHIRCGLVV